MTGTKWIVLACSAVVGFSQLSLATDWYVSTTGNDSAAGSLGNPLATLGTAITKASAGDTIYMRGGTYNIGDTVKISKAGTAANPYRVFAYSGETPVLDFSTETSGKRGIEINSNYWHFKGLTVQNAKDNGVYISGSNNTLEQLRVTANQDSGVQISGGSGRVPSNNLVLNTDSYANYDPANHGENADGFAAKFRDIGPGNVFRGDRAWGNSDDGWDFWAAANGVTVENSFSFKNGFNNFGDSAWAGDGNGLKLGHDSGKHVLRGLVIWGNRLNGIDINGNSTKDATIDPSTADAALGKTYTDIDHGVTIENVTAYLNGAISGDKNFNFDEFVAAYPHLLRNNISLSGSVGIQSGNVADHNTWNGSAYAVDASDFLSLDDSVAIGARLSDGSLPISNFLRLALGSNLIDSGTNVGQAYNGTAPDLGAFESLPEPASMLFGATGLSLLMRRRSRSL